VIFIFVEAEAPPRGFFYSPGTKNIFSPSTERSMNTQTMEKIMVILSCLAAIVSAVIMCRQELRAMADLQAKEPPLANQIAK
jgi:hypothetical protein